MPPAARAARTIAASCTSSGLSKSLSHRLPMLVVYFAGRQGLGQTFVFTEITRLFVEVGPRNAGGAVTPRDTSVRVFPGDVIDVEIPVSYTHLTLPTIYSV